MPTARPDVRSPTLRLKIFPSFNGSPDGKTLAVARVHDTSDVVMLNEK